MNVLIALALIVAIYLGSIPLFVTVALFFLLLLAMRAWVRYTSSRLVASRTGQSRLFFGETATMTVEVRSQSKLPTPWLVVHDQVPAALAPNGGVAQALALPAARSAQITYEIVGCSRGCHTIGPLRLSTGDIFGLAQRELQAPIYQTLIVYPRLLPLGSLDLPSVALAGDLRARRRLLGDPARVQGVREYAQGDPLHDIHWRATASAGSLQVKQYQPTTTVEALIFLDLNRASYNNPISFIAAEFAISLAATLSSRLLDARQQVGLVSNGRLSAPAEAEAAAKPPDAGAEPAPHGPSVRATTARGRAQVVRLLELLARLELDEGATELVHCLTRHALGLPWGSTVIVITGRMTEALFLTLHRLRESGAQVQLYCVRPCADQVVWEARARTLGVALRTLSYAQYQEAGVR